MKPAASFVLLTYNQEQFVRDAVQAALAQTCENIEILISDDCSTDRTFEIVQQEVAAYRGPHKVAINQNSANLGVNAHINACVERVRSDLIVPAAGDDISAPERVEKLLDRFRDETPLLLYSGAENIDAQGQRSARPTGGALFDRTCDPLLAATSFGLFLGATVAWNREIFTTYGPLPDDPAYEDLILGFRAALENRVAFVDEPLVAYRENSGLSAINAPTTRRAWKQKQARIREMNCNVLRQRLQDAQTAGADARLLSTIEYALKINQVRRDINRTTLFHAFRNTPALGPFVKAALSEINARRKGL